MDHVESKSSSVDKGHYFAGFGDALFFSCMMTLLCSFLPTAYKPDRRFLRQLLNFLHFCFALIVLVVLLSLLVAQQLRCTFCSLLRPILVQTHTRWDDLQVSIFLKVLIFLLLIFNFFCAAYLEKMGSSILKRCRYLASGRWIKSLAAILPSAKVDQSKALVPAENEGSNMRLRFVRDVGTTARFPTENEDFCTLRIPFVRLKSCLPTADTEQTF